MERPRLAFPFSCSQSCDLISYPDLFMIFFLHVIKKQTLADNCALTVHP